MHVAGQSAFACHSGLHPDLFEGQNYLFVGAAGIRIHFGSSGTFEEEGILRNFVVLKKKLSHSCASSPAAGDVKLSSQGSSQSLANPSAKVYWSSV